MLIVNGFSEGGNPPELRVTVLMDYGHIQRHGHTDTMRGSFELPRMALALVWIIVTTAGHPTIDADDNSSCSFILYCDLVVTLKVVG